MSEARISIPFPNGAFELEGSEEFIKEYLEKYKDIIDNVIKDVKPYDLSKIVTSTDKSDTTVAVRGIEYENVIEIHDDIVHIISDIPGSSKKEKTVNAALLYLLGTKLAGGNECNFEPIREVCKEHGFLDSTNFSKYLKSEKSSFIFSGSSRSQTIRLSVPGYKKAAELADELNNKS